MPPLAENQHAVDNIKAELEPKILGRELPKFSCGCGAISHGQARAVEVTPAGQGEYAGQETSWYMWTVKMRDNDSPRPEGDYDYSIGLSSFVDTSELEELFARNFLAREA